MKNSAQYFYRNFNQQVIDDFCFWDSHKGEINSLLDFSITNINPKNEALMLGVGNGNDLPLEKIANIFESTTLLDIDNLTLTETKLKLPKELQNKIISVDKDLTKVHDKYSDKYMEYLLKEQNPPKAKKILEKAINDQSVLPKKPLHKTYQLVISSTVSTQLVNNFQIAASSYGGYFKKQIINICVKLSNKATENHLEQISNLLDRNNDSVAIITSEQFVWSKSEEGECDIISSLISDSRLLLHHDYQEVFEKNGLGLVGRITDDLLGKFEILQTKQWIWQFNNQRYYLVKGWVIRNK